MNYQRKCVLLSFTLFCFFNLSPLFSQILNIDSFNIGSEELGRGWNYTFLTTEQVPSSSSLSSIDFPAALHGEEGEHYLWIEKTISVGAVLSTEEPVLFLDKYNGPFSVYINGKMMYREGLDGEDLFYKKGASFGIQLSEGLFPPDTEVVLQICFYADSCSFNLLPFQVIPNKEATTFMAMLEILNIHLNLAFSLISLFIGIYFFIQYVFYRKEKSNLYFALGNLFLFVYQIEMGISVSPFPFTLFHIVGKACLPLFFGFLLLFFIDFFKFLQKRVVYWIISLTMVVSLLLYAFLARDYDSTAAVFNMTLGPGGVELLLMAFISLRAIFKKNRDAIIIFIGVIIGVVCAVFDFGFSFSGITPLFWLQGFGIFFFDVSVFISLALKSIHVRCEIEEYSREVEVKSAKLEEYVENLERVSSGLTQINKEVDHSVHRSSQSLSSLSQNTDLVAGSMVNQFSLIKKADGETRELLDSLSVINQKLENQNIHVEDTTGSMNNMLIGIDGIENSLGETSTYVSSLEDSVDNGKTMILKSVDAMVKVKEASRKINDIVDMINDIAEQTNLLSMNAAIEAAHAGNTGLGFAVVAGEIKKLANRSAHQATEVISHVNQINESIDEGSDVNQRVVEVLGEITDRMGKTSDTVKNVLNLLDQQRESSEAIVLAMDSLRTNAQEIKTETNLQKNHGVSIGKGMEDLLLLSEDVSEGAKKILAENHGMEEEIENLKGVSKESIKQADELKTLLVKEKDGLKLS